MVSALRGNDIGFGPENVGTKGPRRGRMCIARLCRFRSEEEKEQRVLTRGVNDSDIYPRPQGGRTATRNASPTGCLPMCDPLGVNIRSRHLSFCKVSNFIVVAQRFAQFCSFFPCFSFQIHGISLFLQDNSI